MDLSNLALASSAEEGAALHLKHPVTGEPLFCDDGKPMSITVVGMDSDRFRKAERSIANQRLRQAQRRRSSTMSMEDIEKETVRAFAACTLDWSLQMGGKPLPFSTDEAVKLYGNPDYGWIREQLDDFMSDRANFSKASSTT